MKIRLKILLILLAFSLLPLLVMRIHSVNTLTSLGKDLQNQTRRTLLDRTVEDLTHLANGIAKIINLETRLYTTSLKNIQFETEHQLTQNDILQNKTKPFIISEVGEQNRPHLISDPNYKKNTGMGNGGMMMGMGQMHSFQNILISKKAVSFWLPSGLSVKEATPEINSLQNLLPLFKSCNESLKDLFIWIEVSLENGLTLSYPAHDSFPRNYDQRLSPWYRKLKKTHKSGWELPARDPATRALIHRLVAPLLDQNGTFLGSVSIVVPVDVTINQDAVSRFAGKMKMFLVSTNISAKNHGKLLVVAKDDQDREKDKTRIPMGHFWQAPIQTEWLYENNPEFKSLIVDIEEMRPGVLQMPFAGQPSLWTYNPVNKGLSILLIMPTRAFTKDADEAEEYVHESISRHITTVTIIFVVTILTLIIAAYLISLSLSTPIRKISQAVNKIAKGDWSAKAEISSRDELGELAETFNKMIPQLRERAAILQALSLADEAQRNLFPDKLPEIDKVDMAARCVFSQKTGGDYYDFIGCSTCGDKTFAMAIGDVSGHGITAALLMTSARAYIRALTGKNNLVDMVSKVNRLVTKDCMKTGHFITMLAAACDTENMNVKWVRAGHDPAMLYTPSTDTFKELRGPGLALGVDPDFKFEENITNVESGQILVLYTDGIWEAHSPTGSQFGKERLKQIIRDNWDKKAKSIINRILAAVDKHCAGLPIEDDCTLIVVKIL